MCIASRQFAPNKPEQPRTNPNNPEPPMTSPPHNLPQQPTSFVGRDKELQELHQLFASTRLLTLTGVGGTGKTRLALQYAAEKRNDYPDGVWLVDLAPLTDPELVPRAFAGVFGLRDEPGADLADLIVQHLQDKRLLLVIDNCEHLIKQTVRQVESLLTNCPGVAMLATSREALRMEQEVAYTVPSLQTPECDGPENIADSPAVRLFVDRARSVCGSFNLDEENAPAIAAVCRRLDGIPLAIELAAACTRTMTPQEIHLWLNRKFKLLTGGAKTAIKRQRTLRSVIDWSYDLLDESEKTLFDAVSVFRGGWTLEAAERVCTVANIDDVDVLDLLSSLAHRSLVVSESGRYRMLETVRDYAADRLAESGDALVVRDRHAVAFLEFAETASPHLTGPDQVVWLHRVETENDNIRTALAWMAADPDYSESALRLCAAVWRFWASRGHLSEGRRWIDGALEDSGGTGALDVRAQVLNGAGNLAWLQADYGAAQARIDEALPILRNSGARKGLADALNLFGNVTSALGNKPKARALYEESLNIHREIEDRGGIAGSLNNLGGLAIEAGDMDEARRLLEECLGIYK
ncbi:MAG: tetratricopeptide repeat protein, partial [Armatimonadetes bacterium]|nr:tetratricopeptide repeat protein [Armatimonadota bacterium]